MLFSEHPPGLLQDRHLKEALVFILGTCETSVCTIRSHMQRLNHRISTKFIDDCTEIAHQKKKTNPQKNPHDPPPKKPKNFFIEQYIFF